MRVRNYTVGLDVLGADPETNRAILIKVRNAAELARSQGAIASLAQAIAPATIEAKVYSTMADQLRGALRDKRVDADVTVVESKDWKPAGSSHIARDVGLAVGGVGLVAVLWHLFKGRKAK